MNHNRVLWQEERRPIRCLYRSKRYVEHIDVFNRILEWLANHGPDDSIPHISEEDVICLAAFPETF